MEFGLCCLFHKEPIKFKTYTWSSLEPLLLSDLDKGLEKIFTIWDNNISSLQKAIDFCYDNHISSYRVSSDLFPQFTRVYPYVEKYLDKYIEKLKNIDTKGIILSMHPGQFVNLGSPTQSVVDSSIKDLEYHNLLATALKCNEINIHLGGVYGDKQSAINRFIDVAWKLPFIDKITIENDEYSYNIFEVLHVTNVLGIRATYDIHHQFCYEIGKQESFSCVLENIEKASKNWTNYQRIHISSPKSGNYSTTSQASPHADMIDLSLIEDVHLLSKLYNIHADIEAKHKEVAIFDLREKLLKETF